MTICVHMTFTKKRQANLWSWRTSLFEPDQVEYCTNACELLVLQMKK